MRHILSILIENEPGANHARARHKAIQVPNQRDSNMPANTLDDYLQALSDEQRSILFGARQFGS